MISKLAKSTIEKWWSEGLKPSFEDIVLLAALGMKVEKGSEAYNFGAVPRAAFLGDTVLWEPSVGKRIWIDRARQLLSDGLEGQLYFFAYALNTPMAELPDLKSVKPLQKAVTDFAGETLVHFTDTQIMAAVEYAMLGSDWREGEDYGPDEKKAFESVYEVPEEVYSGATQVLAEALGKGMDDSVKDMQLQTLERMIIVSAIYQGSDVLKSEHTQNAGKFYAASGKIYQRLLKEKKDNGEG